MRSISQTARMNFCLKTGYTSTAMYCLSATAQRDGVEFIAVVLHGASIDSRNTDATTLLNYAFANYALCPLIPGESLPLLPVEMGREDLLSLRLDGDAWAVVPKGGAAPEYSLALPERLNAPIRTGDPVGTLTVRQGDRVVAELPVLADQDIPRIGFWGIFTRLAGSLVGF